ncbi:MAG: phosphate ABC transporter substrate-binding protein [Magnetococcales bacterium]|nr:phosphate ABC transporter substrate-binding protein [Magnetococcales bacterium]
MIRSYPKIVSLMAWALITLWGVTAQGEEETVHIHIKGSDTLANVISAWGKAYREKVGEDILIDVSGGGSGNGIAALINGHSDIASTSRKLRKREKRLINKKSKKQPYAVIVGQDAVSVLVHNNNPLNGISIAQLAQIYGKRGEFDNWSDLGIKVPGCESGEIIRVSRKNNSGTYAFFRQALFGKLAHFHADIITFGSSKQLVSHVAKNPCAIGYSGMGFLNASVKTLCVAQTTLEEGCIPPTATFTLDHSYPLSRPLFLYTLGEPKEPIRSFLAWIQDKEGQHILRKAGFVSSTH